MTQRDKLRERFLGMPKDFTWRELVRLLRQYDYKELPNSGTSHRSFSHQVTGDIISLPKPHGGRKFMLKVYLIQVKVKLQIEDE